MSRILVVGGSDQGRQAIDVCQVAGEHEVVGVLDHALEPGTSVAGIPVLGTDGDVADAARASGADGFLVAIGDNFARARVTTGILAANPRLELVSACHPSAVISPSSTIGPGALIMAQAVVSNGCILGSGVLLGTKASLDHDCTVGDHASLAPNATTGGRVAIGECTALLLSATAIHGVEIGAHTVVGAGALVLDGLPDHVVAYGVPAKVARRRDEGEPYLTRRAR